MLACISCGKSKNTVNFSRHKKGSSGAGGNWALRAPISKRLQRPNLHIFRGKKYCTKCLRIAKEISPVQYKTESKPAPVVTASV